MQLGYLPAVHAARCWSLSAAAAAAAASVLMVIGGAVSVAVDLDVALVTRGVSWTTSTADHSNNNWTCTHTHTHTHSYIPDVHSHLVRCVARARCIRCKRTFRVEFYYFKNILVWQQLLVQLIFLLYLLNTLSQIMAMWYTFEQSLNQ